MKLLIITQRVDVEDDNLGFFHDWIEKFAQKLDKVYVICLWRGEHRLPQNVIVSSLGKEKGISKIGQIFLLQKHLFQTIPKVDGIFIHMGSIYALASFPLAKIFRKKIILWYAHVKPNISFIEEKIVSKILTPSKESCHGSNKIIVTGHGIDTDLFKPLTPRSAALGGQKTILTTGRIAPVKDLETLIEAFSILVDKKGMKNIKVKIIGSAAEDYERKYFVRIKDLIQAKALKNQVEFLAGVPHKEIVKLYQTSDIFVNMTGGGGAGKAVLEAMACGTPVILCTKTFNDLLGDFKDEVIFEEKNPKDFAEKLLNCLNFSEQKSRDFGRLLRSIVVSHHNLDNLIDKIINNFK